MLPDLLIAVSAAVAAGACFAVGGVLQQWVASHRPSSESLTLRLLRSLVRDPVWVAGILLALLAYGFQSLALAFGPLALVQPLIVAELVFAIPLSAHLERMRLRAREWLGVGAVTAGLATALVVARPSDGEPTAALGGWLVALSVIVALTGSALWASSRLRGSVRASLIALAGGVVMGSQSVFLAYTITRLERGPLAVLTAWQTYLLVAASIGGLLLIQSAFQAGPLAASMPVFDAVEPLVAVVTGILLFGETVRTGWLAGGLTSLGVVVLVVGIVVLDTSPMLERLHRRAQQEAPRGRRSSHLAWLHLAGRRVGRGGLGSGGAAGGDR